MKWVTEKPSKYQCSKLVKVDEEHRKEMVRFRFFLSCLELKFFSYFDIHSPVPRSVLSTDDNEKSILLRR